MSKIELVFYSSDKSEHNSKMVCFNNQQNEVFIKITDNEYDPHYQQYICLDIPTAIKFSKILRSAINNAKQLEEDG